MIKVKMFMRSNIYDLEDEINEFLSNKNIVLRDVKYAVDDGICYHSAMIIYEEKIL